MSHRSYRPSIEKLEDRRLLSLSPPYLLPGDASPTAVAGTQYEPEIARGADKSLVVWTDNRSSLQDVWLSHTKFDEELGSMHDIYAARLDASGAVIDTTPIIISQGQHYQTWPHVAWNGENWLVAWTTERESDPYSVDLLAVRVASDGTVLDPTPITVFTGGTFLETHSWSVSSDGTNWVVAWTGWNHSFAVRAVTAARVAPDGTVLDPGGKNLRTITQGFFWGADIAFAGDEYLVTWREDVSQYQVKGQRLTPALDPIGSMFTVGTAGQYDVTEVASDGDGFFVVAAGDDVSGSVRGTRVSHTGQVLDPGWLTISSSGIGVDAIWDGTNWLATHSKGVAFGEYDIYASRITSGGTILDPSGFLISGGPSFQSQPAVALGVTGKAQVVWREILDQFKPAADIKTTRIAADYSIGPTGVVDLGAPRQSTPRMASNGSGFLAVFQSEISGESRVQAHPLDAAGNPLDSRPIMVAADNARDPAVAWNGSVYLIVWQGPGNSLNTQIFAKRMLPNGTLLDNAPISVMLGQLPDVAAVGDTFLVTGIFRQTAEIQYVRSIRVTGAGGVIGTPKVVGGSFTRTQRVTAFDGRWLVVGQSHPSHDDPFATVFANFVETDGTTGPSIFVGAGKSPHVTAGSDSALITFDIGNILGRRIGSDGAFLGNSFTISGAVGTQHLSEVAWNGSLYVVTWLDHRNEDFPNQWKGDVFATRVSPNGRILDRPGFAIADSSLPEDTPSVIAANGVTIFAYAGFNPQAPFTNMRLTLRTLTGAPTPPGDGRTSGNDIAFPMTTESTLHTFSAIDRRLDGLSALAVAGFEWDGDGGIIGNRTHIRTPRRMRAAPSQDFPDTLSVFQGVAGL